MAEQEAAVVVEPKASAADPAAPKPDGETRDPNKVYSQEELDRITAKVRKNTSHRTRKEIEAFYQGRESVAAPAKQAAAAEAPKEEAPPERANYESYESYLDARAEYTGKKAARAERENVQKEEAARKASETAAERTTAFQTKVREKFTDIDARMDDVGNMPIHKSVQDALTESEFGADIFNDLVSNPTEFDRLFKMSETSAVREIGKMEARHEAAAKAAIAADPSKSEPVKEVAKQPSKAPAPIKPIVGKTETGDGEPSHDNPDAWRKWRDRQVAARRAGAK